MVIVHDLAMPLAGAGFRGDAKSTAGVLRGQGENVSAETCLAGIWQVAALWIGENDLPVRLCAQPKTFFVHHSVMPPTEQYQVSQ